MPISSEAIKQDLDRLTQDQLQQVAEFIAFLKFRTKRHHGLTLQPSQLAALASEFAKEDRALAEVGIGDYATMLYQEDQV
jgi:hypothetical protein